MKFMKSLSLLTQLREDDGITLEDDFDDNLTTSTGQIDDGMIDRRQHA